MNDTLEWVCMCWVQGKINFLIRKKERQSERKDGKIIKNILKWSNSVKVVSRFNQQRFHIIIIIYGDFKAWVVCKSVYCKISSLSYLLSRECHWDGWMNIYANVEKKL